MNMNNFITLATFAVLLGCSFILGIMGKPTEMGLSILAGAISLSFINIDKIKRFKGAGFEAEMKEIQEKMEKMDAVIEKETEPVDRPTIESVVIDENTIKTIKALLNPNFTLRYLGGIIKESGLSKKEVSETLRWLHDNNYVKPTAGQHGELWSLTSKGRNDLKNLKTA